MQAAYISAALFYVLGFVIFPVISHFALAGIVTVPEVYVSGVKIHRITPTSLEVSWNEVSLHDARGTPAYHVSYWKGNTTNVIAKETVESMILLEGLDSASVYSIAIQVKTAEGMGPPSKPISG